MNRHTHFLHRLYGSHLLECTVSHTFNGTLPCYSRANQIHVYHASVYRFYFVSKELQLPASGRQLWLQHTSLCRFFTRGTMHGKSVQCVASQYWCEAILLVSQCIMQSFWHLCMLMPAIYAYACYVSYPTYETVAD